MPAPSLLPLHLPVPRQDSRPLSTTIPLQQASSPPARDLSTGTTSARPKREASAKARKRVKDAYTLYPSEKDPDSDSDATSTRPSAPPPTAVHSDESNDSDVFVDDSESDCPRLSKAALGKRRKRSASSMMDEGERKRFKNGKSSERDDRRPKAEATGFMVKSGSVMRDILRKDSRAPRESSTKPWVGIQTSSQHPYVRRAGLSNMGRYAGSSVSGYCDEMWTEAPEGLALEGRKGDVRWPVDGNGYRASVFDERL